MSYKHKENAYYGDMEPQIGPKSKIGKEDAAARDYSQQLETERLVEAIKDIGIAGITEEQAVSAVKAALQNSSSDLYGTVVGLTGEVADGVVNDSLYDNAIDPRTGNRYTVLDVDLTSAIAERIAGRIDASTGKKNAIRRAIEEATTNPDVSIREELQELLDEHGDDIGEDRPKTLTKTIDVVEALIDILKNLAAGSDSGGEGGINISH